MKELVETIVKELVDKPDAVSITTTQGKEVIVLELNVDPEDRGKVIGKHGNTARALRTIIGCVGSKKKQRYSLEILNS